MYEHFESSGRYYLAMESIEGETLEQYLVSSASPGGGLPVADVLDIGIELCAALDFLHRHSIIFRDLKPANVMRSPEGHLSLIDFGIARLFKPGQAKDTVALGSVGYAAPEQYGRAQTTVRSDIYSLGATLHHLLTGIDPAATPFRFGALVGGASIFGDLIARMTDIDASRRPGSMALVRAELQALRSGEQGMPLAPLAVLSGAASAPSSADIRSPFVAPGRSLWSFAWSPDGTHLAVGGFGGVDIRERHTLTCVSGLRTRANDGVVGLAWSPDGRLVYTCGSAFPLVDIWEAATGRWNASFGGDGFERGTVIQALALSPDGRLLALGGSNGTLQVWDAAEGSHLCTFSGHTLGVTSLAWSPDSAYIASGGEDQTVRIWNLTWKLCAHLYRGHGKWVTSVSWSPDGTRIVSADLSRTLHIWDASSAENRFIRGGPHDEGINAVAWSPDGTRIASAGTNPAVQLWGGAFGVPEQSLKLTTGVRRLSWSPDGRTLALGTIVGVGAPVLWTVPSA